MSERSELVRELNNHMKYWMQESIDSPEECVVKLNEMKVLMDKLIAIFTKGTSMKDKSGIYAGMSTQAVTDLVRKVGLSGVRTMIDTAFSTDKLTYGQAHRIFLSAQAVYVDDSTRDPG